jgi:hypothetical protein
MHHPFQTLDVIPPTEDCQVTFLLAGSGSALIAINLEDGTVMSKWDAGAVSSGSGVGKVSESEQIKAKDTPLEERPKKRRRGNAEERPNVSRVYAHASRNYAVIITGEDKSIRVFSISSDGIMKQLSQR